MKYLSKLLAIVMLVHMSSCSVLEQAQEVQRFIQCDFSLANIQVLEVGGIQISTIKSPEDIGFLSMMSLGQQVMNNSLPAKLSIGLKATNNNTSTASVTGMEWKLLLKDQDYLGGEINDEVEILANSSSVFPVNVNVDLFTIFEKESLQQMLGFAFSENKAEELKNMGVGIKIKPFYKVGSDIQKYPGWLSISL